MQTMSPSPVHGSPRAQNRALAATGLVLFLGGLIMAAVFPRGDDGGSATSTSTATTTQPAKPRVAPAKVVRLTAVGVLDPEGDDRENDELAPLAVDGDVTTAWRTERYTSFFKPGVGLVLDAGRKLKITRVDLVSATPGFVAEIRAGDSREGPFKRIAAGRVVQETTRFPVAGLPGRYVVVWITKLPDSTAADVDEVVLRGRRAGVSG
jgi:hypothetical protein